MNWKTIIIILSGVLLFIFFIVIHYLKSPIYSSNSSSIVNQKYKIICYSEWENKVLNIQMYINSFSERKEYMIFEILNKKEITAESLILCPTLIKLDSLSRVYKVFNIEIYKENVSNVDEVGPDYIYKLSYNNLDNSRSTLFIRDYINLELIK